MHATIRCERTHLKTRRACYFGMNMKLRVNNLFGAKDDGPSYTPEQEAKLADAIAGFLRRARRAEIALRIHMHKANGS